MSNNFPSDRTSANGFHSCRFISHGWHVLSPYVLLDYHELGSLDHYLRSQKLSWPTCYAFLLSLVEAVDYLHFEDLSPNVYFPSGRVRKPIILHRDIKSSNVLVKSTPQLSLCLADFGLAKILPSILTAHDFIQIGTYRYMAPELLELAISHTSEALCRVDMYALGLVLWEILSQCKEYSGEWMNETRTCRPAAFRSRGVSASVCGVLGCGRNEREPSSRHSASSGGEREETTGDLPHGQHEFGTDLFNRP